jgi:tetratricopeptide (TPR) repeat protein
VRGHLLAYAKRLQFDAGWRLAGDVYRTFVESRPPHDVSADAMEAAFQCGYCFRMAGDIDEAARAYDLGEAIAVAARDSYGMLRARVCQAKLSAHRGNLPRAEAELDAVIAAAEAAGSGRALSLALTDRMAIAGRRGQYEAAATFGYRALRCCEDELERDRILSDLATALGDAGHRQAARDAHLVLSVTARDQSVAWLSMLNLMELAVGDGSEVEFERHRRALAGVALPAVQRAHFHLIVGDGQTRFGRRAAAAAAYRSAIALAEECGANDLVLRAEAALEAVERRRAGHAGTPDATTDAGPVTIEEVVRAMHELRETVGAGR